MTKKKESQTNWFEKIVIKDPSVLVCLWLFAQFLMLAWLFDGGPYRHENLSYFQQWYGFWIFSPTHLFNIFLCIFIMLNQTMEVSRIEKVYDNVAPPASTAYERVSDNIDPLDAFDVQPTPQPAEKSWWRVVSGEEDGGDDRVAGYQKTAIDYAREAALNRSLLAKWLITWPVFIFASVKISYDQDDKYSWFVVFIPLYMYLAVLLAVAIQRKNWFMRSQGEIDAEEDAEREKRLELRTRLVSEAVLEGARGGEGPYGIE